MRNKKQTLLIWGIIFGLSAGTWLANVFFGSNGVLGMRVITILFFIYLFRGAKKLIDSFKWEVKEGYAEHLFEPKYLYTVLWLTIFGLIGAAVMDFFYLPTWWLLPYLLGVAIIPFSSGVIPLRRKDNKWRK